MKTTAVVTALFLANVALGARFTEQRRSKFAKRAAQTGVRSGWSNPRLPAAEVDQDEFEAGNGTAHVDYSTNWGGAVLIGSGYKSVTGTFVVPTPKGALLWRENRIALGARDELEF